MSFGLEGNTPAFDQPMTPDYDDRDNLSSDQVEDDDLGLDLDEDSSEAPENSTEPQTPARGAARRSARPRAAGLTRAAVKRVLAKSEQVASASPESRALAASLLSVSDDPAEITIAILTSARGAGSAITDVIELAEQAKVDVTDALVEIASKPKDRFRAVHALLVQLSSEVPATLPPSETKAAAVLAKAAAKIDVVDLASLSEVTDLLRRS